MQHGIWAKALAVLLVLGGLGIAGPAEARVFRHIFVIVLENEGFETTFGAARGGAIPDPYFRRLADQGVFFAHYYGIGHHSLDNYIAMVSGQGPNSVTQGDCPKFIDFEMTGVARFGQAVGQGCVYPVSIATLANQLAARGLRWRGYMEDMGNDTAREAAVCGHPPVGAPDNTQRATSRDQYASRHDPFVYFHAIIDKPDCAKNVVNLSALPGDLAAEARTPNFVFITPNLCNDGHDGGPGRPCANGDTGGLVSADRFLAAWVPQILASPAFKKDGLLAITFDEADTDDATACCGEEHGPNIRPDQKVFGEADQGPGITGPGGGRIGLVAMAPGMHAHCVTTPYNHYGLLRTIEDQFGLAHLGYAAQPGVRSLAGEIYARGAHGGC